jgi:hypothetical protein
MLHLTPQQTNLSPLPHIFFFGGGGVKTLATLLHTDKILPEKSSGVISMIQQCREIQTKCFQKESGKVRLCVWTKHVG